MDMDMDMDTHTPSIATVPTHTTSPVITTNTHDITALIITLRIIEVCVFQ